MNKLISLTFFFIFLCPLLSAEICNIKGSWKGIPEGSCTQTGFVCGGIRLQSIGIVGN